MSKTTQKITIHIQPTYKSTSLLRLQRQPTHLLLETPRGQDKNEETTHYLTKTWCTIPSLRGEGKASQQQAREEETLKVHSFQIIPTFSSSPSTTRCSEETREKRRRILWSRRLNQEDGSHRRAKDRFRRSKIDKTSSS